MGEHFLLEIGTEEMPAGSMEEARAELQASLKVLLDEQRLVYHEVTGYVAPRRLVAWVVGLEAHQQDLDREVRGPAVKVAYDDNGRPTRAAEGFARSQGVSVSELHNQGGYVYAVKHEQGRPTVAVLGETLPGLLANLRFPKSMRWGDKSLRFLRPIRWLVALYGTEVVPFSLAGVSSGRHSYGHRFLNPGTVALAQAGGYRQALAQAGVIVDQDERRKLVAEQVKTAAAGVGGQAIIQERFLDEVANLVEHPTAVLGSFASQHLALPDEVLITVMAKHQRFFPVQGPGGELLPYFVGVRDGGDLGLDQVQSGYERVLEARLVDATFFYSEDLKEPLSVKAERLKDVIFQEQLGTMWDKACRLQYLVRWLAEQLGLDAAEVDAAVQAAYLAKADLLTNMVYEFPELQGTMGGYYASQQGQSPLVATAIREHYQPRFSGDALPRTAVGTVVSLADKLDTLVGYWSIGVTPTGSQDPFGLRRLAYGLCLILLDKGLRLSLRELLLQAYGQYQAFGQAKVSFAELEESLGEFCRQRLANILEERGIRYDVVNAVLAVDWQWLAGTLHRASALQEFLTHPALGPLVTTYTRARNLARDGTIGPIQPGLFQETPETELYQALQAAQAEVADHLAAGNYQAALLALSRLERPLATFFDQVLVMTEDQAIKANRLALLQGIVACVKQIADLAQIQ